MSDTEPVAGDMSHISAEEAELHGVKHGTMAAKAAEMILKIVVKKPKAKSGEDDVPAN